MYFLENNPKIKLIPDEVKGATNGVVTEYNSENFLVLLENINSLKLDINDIVEIMVSLETCIIRFDAKVKAFNAEVVTLSLPESYKTVQRREYVRVDVNIPVEIKEVTPEGKELNSMCQDLSGGGLKLLAPESFKEGALLEARLKIVDQKSISTVMEVLRVNSDNDSSLDYYISGRFVKISNSDRTAIIQLCFKRQLEKSCKADI